MTKKFTIKCREEGRGRASINRFSTLAGASKFIQERWQGVEYRDNSIHFHTDYATYELVGFTLRDIGKLTVVHDGEFSWDDYEFTPLDLIGVAEPVLVRVTHPIYDNRSAICGSDSHTQAFATREAAEKWIEELYESGGEGQAWIELTPAEKAREAAQREQERQDAIARELADPLPF